MTIASPPGDHLLDDPLDRAVRSGAREEALDILTRAVMSDAGREEVRSVLVRRLRDRTSRQKTQHELNSELPESEALSRMLLGALSLKSTSEAADEMVRILGVAVDSSTSENVMRRAMRVVLRAVTHPDGPGTYAPDLADPSGVRSAPARPDRPLTGEARLVAADPRPPAPVRPRPPAYDPHGRFRIPDRVVRFGELDDQLAAPLFAASDGARGAGPVRIPSALPAPPATDDPELIQGWLRGVPAFPDSLAVRAGLLDLGDPGDLMEIEAEFHTDPKAALRLYKAARPVGDGTADAAWCARLGRDVGRFGVTHERAVEALAHLLGDQIRKGPADRYAPLARSGAVLVVREELAEAVCGLIDAEAEFLEDGPAETHGPEQNLLGSFSSSGDLSRGRCLERALSLHLVAGLPMGGAMRQSLTEFRIAQALRENPEASVSFLNDRFNLDAALPLSELCGREPIVRIGMTIPVLA